LLDITLKETREWLKEKTKALVESLDGKVSILVDSGNALHTPMYFEVEQTFQYHH